MAWSGCIDGVADGDPRDAWLAVRARAVLGGVEVAITPHDLLRGDYYAVFINGVWRGPNLKSGLGGDIEHVFAVDPGTDSASIWVENVGGCESFSDEFIPSEYAEMMDAQNAPNLRIRWGDRYSNGVSGYTLTPVSGDEQLSSIVVSGARRNLNVERVDEFRTRGRLYYSIELIDGVYFVRWWANGLLVASGSRTGSGSITCYEANASGLSVTCVLTYAVDVFKGTAWLDVRWPAAYRVYYSREALIYTNKPQATLFDNGGDAYVYLSPSLASGAWNYNVIAVDDDGNIELEPPVPSDSPITILNAPAAPTITSVTSVVTDGATTLTANFTHGESGCTYTAYSSPVDAPINFGQVAAPAPAGPSLVDATSISLAPITYTPVDNTTDYATVVAALDAAASALNTAFDAGETGFLATLDAQADAVKSAIRAFEAAIKKSLSILIEAHAGSFAIVRAQAALYDGAGVDPDDWAVLMTPVYGGYLATLSELSDGHPNHYALPDGTLPRTLPDGSTGAVDLSAANLLESVLPMIKPGYVRVVIRSKKGSVEELGDQPFVVELTTGGDAESVRPNMAEIQRIDSLIGLALKLTAAVRETNAKVLATSLELMVDGVAVATVALPRVRNQLHMAQLSYTFGAAGWYEIGVRSIAVSGARAAAYATEQQYIGGDATGTVAGLSAQAIRGRA